MGNPTVAQRSQETAGTNANLASALGLVLALAIAACGGSVSDKAQGSSSEDVLSPRNGSCLANGWEQDVTTGEVWPVDAVASGNSTTAWCACLSDCPVQPTVLKKLQNFAAVPAGS